MCRFQLLCEPEHVPAAALLTPPPLMADNSVWAQWHRMNVPHELVERMDPMKQSLFRGVWQLGPGGNREYSEDNRG